MAKVQLEFGEGGYLEYENRFSGLDAATERSKFRVETPQERLEARMRALQERFTQLQAEILEKFGKIQDKSTITDEARSEFLVKIDALQQQLLATYNSIQKGPERRFIRNWLVYMGVNMHAQMGLDSQDYASHLVE